MHAFFMLRTIHSCNLGNQVAPVCLQMMLLSARYCFIKIVTDDGDGPVSVVSTVLHRPCLLWQARKLSDHCFEKLTSTEEDAFGRICRETRLWTWIVKFNQREFDCVNVEILDTVEVPASCGTLDTLNLFEPTSPERPLQLYHGQPPSTGPTSSSLPCGSWSDWCCSGSHAATDRGDFLCEAVYVAGWKSGVHMRPNYLASLAMNNFRVIWSLTHAAINNAYEMT